MNVTQVATQARHAIEVFDFKQMGGLLRRVVEILVEVDSIQNSGCPILVHRATVMYSESS